MKKRIVAGHDPAKPTFLDLRASTLLLATFALLALLAGCSSESSKPATPVKEEPKGPEISTGRIAFQRMYVAARGWASDAQPYKVESYVTSDGNGHDGKAALWRASFASPSRRAV